VFAYVYKLPDEGIHDLMVEAQRLFNSDEVLSAAHAEFLTAVYREYIHSNALNPNLFPGLRQMEVETVRTLPQWSCQDAGSRGAAHAHASVAR